MIDLAERCRVALEVHAESSLRESAAKLEPDTRAEFLENALDGKRAREDRVRYFEAVERALVLVLGPAQELVDRLDVEGTKTARKLELSVDRCWCDPLDYIHAAHSDRCRFLASLFARLEGGGVAPVDPTV